MLKSFLVAFAMLMTIGLANAGDVKPREGKTMIVQTCNDPDCDESPVSLNTFTPTQASGGQSSCSCSSCSCSGCSGPKCGLFSKLKSVVHRPLFHRRGCK